MNSGLVFNVLIIRLFLLSATKCYNSNMNVGISIEYLIVQKTDRYLL